MARLYYLIDHTVYVSYQYNLLIAAMETLNKT